MKIRSLFAVVLVAVSFVIARADQFKFPLASGSARFAVIGDTGTGEAPQYELAKQMVTARGNFPFDFVLMLGDNIYGASHPKDYEQKFDLPYKPLLDAGVKFYACLGNHDNPNERMYKLFNMNGANYYTFKKGNARFFALDSDYMDAKQLAWLENELKSAGDQDWKICYFHHPLYSSGRTHGSAIELRALLEPLFVKYGVNVVFAGHDHVYERVRPQKGIYYFTEGSSGQLRAGGLKHTDLTEKGFDSDRAFMLVEIAGDQLHFETLSSSGHQVDSGTLPRLSSVAK